MPWRRAGVYNNLPDQQRPSRLVILNNVPIRSSIEVEEAAVVTDYSEAAFIHRGTVKSLNVEIKKLGGDGVAVQADMSTMDGIKTLFKATADAYDEPVGVLVNNAGITRDTLVRVRSCIPLASHHACQAHHSHHVSCR